MNAPTVAICLPTYNQGKYLPESVSSASQQDYPGVEVWVSDDASTDDTPSVMEALCQKFPQVRYRRQPANLGISLNNNWLLSQPSTDFIVRLDSDDRVEPSYVATLLALMEKYPAAGYAHASIREIDENGNPRRIRRLGGRGEYQDDAAALRASSTGYRVAANIVMFRREALQALGFYRPGMNFAEDWDLSIRFADAGWGNAYCPEILGSYRVWTDAGNVRPMRKALELRGCVIVHEESLGPAFKRRGWDIGPLQAQRTKLALAHAASLASPIFKPEERAEIEALLIQLGGEKSLRPRIRLINKGWAPFFAYRDALFYRLKDGVKTVLAILSRRAVK